MLEKLSRLSRHDRRAEKDTAPIPILDELYAMVIELFSAPQTPLPFQQKKFRVGWTLASQEDHSTVSYSCSLFCLEH